MKEKDIKELLEAAKIVNRFRSLASMFVCPICGEPLEGDIESISLTRIVPFGRLFCPNCKLFRVEGPTISDTGDGKDGKKLSRKEVLIKASTGVVALVERYTHFTLLSAEHEKDFSDKDIPFLR